MMSNEIFREHKTCETAGQCELLGECQRAMNITIEMRYEKQKPGSSSLRFVLKTQKCQHTEAIDAAKKAQQFLNSFSPPSEK
ncbi:hypothetical protein A3E15_02095 [Candidatus Woesebacteria bacterium RIFCSPHIGHO2_12_FULL_42_9]|uniref:Uncharacterized protein n=2 Tax=Candidatus Woeseibacteriota TaxID=1752722 RepID=A0A1F8APK9_9BACT|nr:MAG: hypothetical protein A2129_01550 [Candidatus Woesebacteria bacterium GWC1_42_13]OGM53707.1 MAG: hypothetical protein A3E15_02095 [Candidatus Woesebacteria bacterium RIFCSPHIGHO2_12_FULL_42_9]